MVTATTLLRGVIKRVLLLSAISALAAIAIATVSGRGETAAIVIPSPSGATVIEKQYGPFDQADYVSLYLRKQRSFIRRSVLLPPTQNPSGIIGDDGITIGWTGEHHITIGWPQGAKSIGGPGRVDDVDVDYRSYVPDLTSQQTIKARELTLHGVSLKFSEVDAQNGSARYTATGKPVPLIECVVEINGADGQVFDQVMFQIIGHGVGRAADPYPSFGAVGIKVSVKPLPDGKSPALTLTQAEVAGTFPRNDIDVAPGQDASSVSYQTFNTTEAEQIFASIKKGSLDAKIALTFGKQVLAYHLNLPTAKAVVKDFNACSAKTNIYGEPFSIPEG